MKRLITSIDSRKHRRGVKVDAIDLMHDKIELEPPRRKKALAAA